MDNFGSRYPLHMARIRPDADPIGYLLERRFPNHELIAHLPPSLGSLSGPGTITAEGRRQLSQQVEAHRKELQAKTPEELSALVAKARAEEAAAWRMRCEQEEKARFFNQHNARADIDHWSKATYWTLDEAVALTFGKNPEVVTWEKIRGLTSVSVFAAQFARVRDLVFRAKNWQQLYDPALPTFFLAWAQRNEIGVPDELVKAVEARGVVIADWKDLHDNLKEQFDALVEDRAKVWATFQKLAEQRDALKLRVDELEEQAAAWQFDESAENYPRELDVAMQAWWAVSKQRDSSMTVKQQISAWLGKNYPKLSEESRERIATICNWEKRGGRRSQDQ